MIIFEDMSYQKSSASPDTNYLEGLDCPQPCWVVPDSTELANKIISTPYWKPVTDEDGNLIDITPTDPPVTPEEQIAELKSQLTAIDMQTVRPMRAITAGTATEEDRDKLEELETQAEALRAELAARELREDDTEKGGEKT